MTYHYDIKRTRSLKGARFWTDRIFLALMLLTTLVIAFYNSTELNLMVAILGIVAFSAMALLVIRRPKVPFVEIAEGTLSYFDTAKGEMVSVPIENITHISTRFCELNVHTAENIHSLNLDLIRSEKARWEIKEMIRTSLNYKQSLE